VKLDLVPGERGTIPPLRMRLLSVGFSLSTGRPLPLSLRSTKLFSFKVEVSTGVRTKLSFAVQLQGVLRSRCNAEPDGTECRRAAMQQRNSERLFTFGEREALYTPYK